MAAMRLEHQGTHMINTPFSEQLGIDYPIICGAMYPCSNPELVAAASAAGGIGIVQPISLTYVHGHDLRDGLRYIRSLTDKPIGFNALVEQSVKTYEDRMRKWVDIALEEGVRFFITALGKPDWVVKAVHEAGGLVYHDVTERKWATKALDAGVDGLICVNDRAGGHAGNRDPRVLFDELVDLGVPLIRAGGIGGPQAFIDAMDTGYAGVQLGTRFIATSECSAHDDYKQAIIDASADDIVLTEKLSGVPCSVINTPHVAKIGTKAGPLARWLLNTRRGKHFMRAFYSLTSLWTLKRASQKGASFRDYWAAGKSVADVDRVLSAEDVIHGLAEAYLQRQATATAASTDSSG